MKLLKLIEDVLSLYAVAVVTNGEDIDDDKLRCGGGVVVTDAVVADANAPPIDEDENDASLSRLRVFLV